MVESDEIGLKEENFVGDKVSRAWVGNTEIFQDRELANLMDDSLVQTIALVIKSNNDKSRTLVKT